MRSHQRLVFWSGGNSFRVHLLIEISSFRQGQAGLYTRLLDGTMNWQFKIESLSVIIDG